MTAQALSPHVTHRLNSFADLVNDPGYGKNRAIKGLKAWQGSNGHRLTDADHAAIKWALYANK